MFVVCEIENNIIKKGRLIDNRERAEEIIYFYKQIWLNKWNIKKNEIYNEIYERCGNINELYKKRKYNEIEILFNENKPYNFKYHFFIHEIL